MTIHPHPISCRAGIAAQRWTLPAPGPHSSHKSCCCCCGSTLWMLRDFPALPQLQRAAKSHFSRLDHARLGSIDGCTSLSFSRPIPTTSQEGVRKPTNWDWHIRSIGCSSGSGYGYRRSVHKLTGGGRMCSEGGRLQDGGTALVSLHEDLTTRHGVLMLLLEQRGGSWRAPAAAAVAAARGGRPTPHYHDHGNGGWATVGG